jgi:hypothetical protein
MPKVNILAHFFLPIFSPPRNKFKRIVMAAEKKEKSQVHKVALRGKYSTPKMQPVTVQI